MHGGIDQAEVDLDKEAERKQPIQVKSQQEEDEERAERAAVKKECLLVEMEWIKHAGARV